MAKLCNPQHTARQNELKSKISLHKKKQLRISKLINTLANSFIVFDVSLIGNRTMDCWNLSIIINSIWQIDMLWLKFQFKVLASSKITKIRFCVGWILPMSEPMGINCEIWLASAWVAAFYSNPFWWSVKGYIYSSYFE